MSQSSPTKKHLTDEAHSSQSAVDQAPNTYISDELRLALQSRGSRVRKSVMEGYRTTPATSTQQSVEAPSETAPSIFRSARDINGDIFKPTVSPFCSPKKRGRFQYEDSVESSDEETTDVEMDDMVQASLIVKSADTPIRRPMKPLRKFAPQASPVKTPINPTNVLSGQPRPQAASVDPQHDPFLD